jgi:HlyD family secretion protein
MQKRQILVALLMLAAVVLLSGCGGTEAAEAVAADEVPVVAQEAEDKVVAEAAIEPDRWSELHFDAGGDVIEVLVEEGDTVLEGDVLARLETEALERAVAQAELNLCQAELRLEQLQEPVDEADVRQAEHAIDQAAAALRLAQMNVATILDTTLLNETLEDAQKVFDDLQHKYDARLELYESGKEPDYWFVDQAKERLDDARLNLDRIRQQGNLQLQDARNEVVRAQQTHQEAEDNLEQLLKGADEHDVAAARLDIETAELALDEARSNLEEATLRASLAGIVTQVNLETGETAAPGEVILVLATLDRLQARTTDLTELDVARVVEGQAAVVTVDALPEQAFAGVVREIALQPGDYRGDVVYAVTVELTDATDAPLRWGMTALVEIEAD